MNGNRGIPANRLSLIFTCKIWKMGSKGYFVKIPRELEQKIKSWLNEEIYVLLLPVSELSRQQVIVKTGEEHGD